MSLKRQSAPTLFNAKNHEFPLPQAHLIITLIVFVLLIQLSALGGECCGMNTINKQQTIKELRSKLIFLFSARFFAHLSNEASAFPYTILRLPGFLCQR